MRTRTLNWYSWAVAALLVFSACVHRRASAGGAPRCYALTVGRWQVPDSAHGDPVPVPEVIVLYPARIAFDSRDTSLHGLLGLSRQPEWARADSAFRNGLSAWRQPERELIIATFSTGYGGVQVDLRGSGATLTGTARAFSDVIGPAYPTAPATARRVACPPAVAGAPAS